MRAALRLFVCTFLAGFALARLCGQKLPPNMFLVKPVPRSAAPNASQELRIARGRHFSYAMPQDWRVGEDGQFALTLMARDNQAFTVMVGNAGMLPNYPPDRFVREKLLSIQPRNLQLGQPRPVSPASGFQTAYQFDVAYTSQRGLPCRGVAKCSVAKAYDTAVMAMTGAFSVETQWSGYSSWLPLMADQISAIDGAAFGKRGIMAQNLQLSREYGEATRAYREWSQRNWQQVTDQRNASADKKNFYLRENLGSTLTYSNPYNAGATVELPSTYQYYWVNRQGQYAGTNDPSVNPNDGSTGDWKRLPRYKP